MTRDKQIEGKVQEWLIPYRRKQPTPPLEQLCHDCPEIKDEVKERIERVKAAYPQSDTSPSESRVDVEPARPLADPAAFSPGGSIPSAPFTQVGEPPAVAGQVLRVGGGYTLLERLGAGGCGEVWKAVDDGGVPAAVKIIRHPADHALRRREEDALQKMKGLTHPYLCTIRSYRTLPDQLVIVMDLADCSLSGRLQEVQATGKEGIPREELIQYFKEAAEALDDLHKQGMFHRDVKPTNILLVGGGGGGRKHVCLADFGLVRAREKDETVSSAGTKAYMAPEARLGHPIEASDQYSLALTYAELRLGQLPADVKGEIARSPILCTAERTALLQALSDNANLRYPTCLPFVQALERSHLQEDHIDLPPNQNAGEPKAEQSSGEESPVEYVKERVPRISIGLLPFPLTPYLFGREAQLRALTDAWGKANVLT